MFIVWSKSTYITWFYYFLAFKNRVISNFITSLSKIILLRCLTRAELLVQSKWFWLFHLNKALWIGITISSDSFAQNRWICSISSGIRISRRNLLFLYFPYTDFDSFRTLISCGIASFSSNILVSNIVCGRLVTITSHNLIVLLNFLFSGGNNFLLSKFTEFDLFS